jgi:hypothetical protein
MLNEIFANSLNFKQHIEFAQQIRKLQWKTKSEKC